MLSRERVIKFGIMTLKGIKGYTRTKTNQYIKSNLSMEKLRSKVATARKRGSAWSRRYYFLINRKRISEAILLEMENVISIIKDHIKYLEAQKIRNTKAASDRSLTFSKPSKYQFLGNR